MAGSNAGAGVPGARACSAHRRPTGDPSPAGDADRGVRAAAAAVGRPAVPPAARRCSRSRPDGRDRSGRRGALSLCGGHGRLARRPPPARGGRGDGAGVTRPVAGGLFYHLGDVVYPHGEEAGYRDQFFSPYVAYTAPIFAIPGNHDGELTPASTAAPLPPSSRHSAQNRRPCTTPR
ncbi:MAG: metallophosphoesterase [Solirubrobacteraceae bacterium]